MDGLSVLYNFSAFDEKYAFNDDGLFTYSSTEQVKGRSSSIHSLLLFLDACLDMKAGVIFRSQELGSSEASTNFVFKFSIDL